ncbi:MAG: pyrroline-5-carboxylate reductase [Dongiaceae bacterium]
MKNPLLLVGAGHMGQAMLGRWQQAGFNNISVINPSPKPMPAGVKFYQTIEAVPGAGFDTIIFAIKPQKAAESIPAYAKFKNALFISILAGTSLAQLEGWLGKETKIIRAMPNLPAQIGQGIIALYAAPKIKKAERDMAGQIFAPLGAVSWMEQEEQMNIATALSGSGSAYVFLFMEALHQAAIKEGLPSLLAKELIQQTVIGSAMLADKNKDWAALARQVTSKGGTTEAALNILQQDNVFAELLHRAVAAAHDRAKKLAE